MRDVSLSSLISFILPGENDLLLYMLLILILNFLLIIGIWTIISQILTLNCFSTLFFLSGIRLFIVVIDHIV